MELPSHATRPRRSHAVRKRSLSHLSDSDLLQAFAAINCRDRATLAELLEHLVELDQRRLYAPAGYRSMFAFCTEKLHWSEDVAFKRIRAARTARRFPAILNALASGQVHLSAVVL